MESTTTLKKSIYELAALQRSSRSIGVKDEGCCCNSGVQLHSTPDWPLALWLVEWVAFFETPQWKWVDLLQEKKPKNHICECKTQKNGWSARLVIFFSIHFQLWLLFHHHSDASPRQALQPGWARPRLGTLSLKSGAITQWNFPSPYPHLNHHKWEEKNCSSAYIVRANPHTHTHKITHLVKSRIKPWRAYRSELQKLYAFWENCWKKKSSCSTLLRVALSLSF